MTTIDKYFTLDEAAALLPWVRDTLVHANTELLALYDEMVLAKRLYALKYADRLPGQEEQQQALELKIQRFEQTIDRWTARFKEQGIIVRNLQKGIIDFPYRTKDKDLLYLVWRKGDDGILYFYEANESARGRRPIVLLPD
ncbi:MAG: DUF2203 family protein [Candidatus Melainabacteria bacterium]|jgi:hypothetical protein|nr:DUF2203 family protein [Candidatus Melainabacteria bacterium]